MIRSHYNPLLKFLGGMVEAVNYLEKKKKKIEKNSVCNFIIPPWLLHEEKKNLFKDEEQEKPNLREGKISYYAGCVAIQVYSLNVVMTLYSYFLPPPTSVHIKKKSRLTVFEVRQGSVFSLIFPTLMFVGG